MRKLIVVLMVVFMLLATAGTALAAAGPVGPNPDAADCVPNEEPYRPNADADSGVGPAPDSGDCIPNLNGG